MDKKTNHSDESKVAMETDATIRSNDSSYPTASIVSNEPQKKVKAYVDFTDFNRNYAEYMAKKKATSRNTDMK